MQAAGGLGKQYLQMTTAGGLRLRREPGCRVDGQRGVQGLKQKKKAGSGLGEKVPAGLRSRRRGGASGFGANTRQDKGDALKRPCPGGDHGNKKDRLLGPLRTRDSDLPFQIPVDTCIIGRRLWHGAVCRVG